MGNSKNKKEIDKSGKPKSKEPEVIPPPKPKAPEFSEKIVPIEAEEKEIGKTLDTLSVGAIDGIDPKIEAKLKKLDIKTLEQLVLFKPEDIYPVIGIPLHKLMGYEKKAQMILDVELDDNIINTLAAKKYTVAKIIEEHPEKIIKITKRSKEDVMNFLGKVIQISMFLDTNTCRKNSVSILHRTKKKPAKVKKRKVPKEGAELTLDTLSVLSIDGIGPELEERLSTFGINTIYDLMRVNPVVMYSRIKIPVYRLMEYRKKAQMILQLDFDYEIIDTLAKKDYTIEGAIEEEPKILVDITGKNKENIMKFIENVVQITMFLDVDTCRNNSIAILRKSRPIRPMVTVIPKPTEAISEEYFDFLGKEQILSKIYAGDREHLILELLREKARNKSEIAEYLEDRGLACSNVRELNDVIDLFVRSELVQLEWFKGNYDVHLFLISDFTIFRSPVVKIISEAKENLPTPIVSRTYLEEVGSFFSDYSPNRKDNFILAKNLLDPDIFVTLTVLRERSYPLEKFPKGFGQEKIDMQTVIRKMEAIGLVKIIPDETKKEWVLLCTDVAVPQFFPEYIVENIRSDAKEQNIRDELALKHLDLLEINYEASVGLYNKFFETD